MNASEIREMTASQLNEKLKELNEELARKRAEFGLEDDK